MNRTSKSLVFTTIVATVGVSVVALTSTAHADDPKSRLRTVLESWFPTVDTEEDSDEIEALEAMMPEAVLSQAQLESTHPWQPPVFANQKQALGWSEKTFETPVAMKDRVAFWKDIYAKYTTSQGVLHDPVTLATYNSVNFPTVADNGGMGSALNAKTRSRIIDENKAVITSRLLRLHQRVQQGLNENGLEGEDLRYWQLFKNSSDAFRFSAAASRIRFQLGQKDRFFLGIYYSGRYLRQMETIFREEGLPIELTRLPFVESSFNLNARSKVGASGIWQFMPRTAKAYMKVTKEVDERNDPLIATRSAARLLRGNYQMLGSWSLALTGYNHGAYGVKQAVNKFGSNDISELVSKFSSRTFGFASQNFYACFLAALETEREAKEIFGEPQWSPAIESGELKAPKLMAWPTLTKIFDDNEVLAMEFNPHLLHRARDAKARIPEGTRLRVPLVRLELAKQVFQGKVSSSQLAAKLKETPMPKSMKSGGAILEAAKSSVQERLTRRSEAAEVVIPWLIDESKSADTKKALFTPASEQTPVKKLELRSTPVAE